MNKNDDYHRSPTVRTTIHNTYRKEQEENWCKSAGYDDDNNDDETVEHSNSLPLPTYCLSLFLSNAMSIADVPFPKGGSNLERIVYAVGKKNKTFYDYNINIYMTIMCTTHGEWWFICFDHFVWFTIQKIQSYSIYKKRDHIDLIYNTINTSR